MGCNLTSRFHLPIRTLLLIKPRSPIEASYLYLSYPISLSLSCSALSTMAEARGVHLGLSNSFKKTEPGVHRTICITNIPCNASPHDIVRQLGPGVVTKVKTPGLTVSLKPRHMLVTFLDQHDALDCIQRTRQRLETLQHLQGHQTPMTMGEEPIAAYPLAQEMRPLIEMGALSRIILLEDVDNHMSHEILADSLADRGVRWHGILAIETVSSSQTHNALHVHMGSIDSALRCYTKALNLPLLASTSIRFLPDPSLVTITSSEDERAEALRVWIDKSREDRDQSFTPYRRESHRRSFRTDHEAVDAGMATPRGPRGWTFNYPRALAHTPSVVEEHDVEDVVEEPDVEDDVEDDTERTQSPQEPSPMVMGILIEGLEDVDEGECEVVGGAVAEGPENVMDAE